MASLVLGAAGAFAGSFFGPLGASIGWSVGSALGSALDPQKVEGPRLTDLKLQGSQYGATIPIPYGACRVSGQVIFQTDLHEHSETSSGKGGPRTTEYTYSASFAILLSEGPIAALSRIWADSRLVHDAASYENDALLDFTLYLGTEEQLPDPTMEAEFGVGNVPAHRGYAYIVFNEIDLGDYGNRLPNFTFEIFTAVDQTIGLHEVNRTTGLAVEWGNYTGGTGTPWITRWPPAGQGQIVVKNMEGGVGHDYNNPELTYSGTTNDPGPNEFNIEVWGPGLSQMWLYQSVGYTTLEGVEYPLFVYPQFAVDASAVNPPLVANNAYSVDGFTVTTDREVASIAGMDNGLYIGGISLSTNGANVLIFTAPSYGADVDTWHMMVDGTIETTGAITPTIPFGYLGYGPWDSGGTGQVNALENSGEYMWHLDADNNDQVSLYRIVEGVFALDAVAGTFDLDDGAGGSKPTIRAIKEGFIGIVMSDTVAVVSRMPLSVSEGVSLSQVVNDLCDRAGLAPSEYDTDQLSDDFVHGYAIAQQGQVRPVIGTLQAAYFFDAVESEASVRFVKRTNDPIITIPDDDLAAAGDGENPPPGLGYTRQQEFELPRVVTVNYINPDEDYQQGSQPAKRDTTLSELETTLALAVAMNTATARRIADRALWMSWIERDRFKLSVARKYAAYEPTDVVSAGSWTMRLTSKREIPNGPIEFDAVATAARAYVPATVPVPGLGFTPTRPPIKQQTDAMLLDVPFAEDDDFTVGVYVAASGKLSTAWSGAGLFQSKDEGVNFHQIGSIVVPATMGKTTDVLGDYPASNMWDEVSSVTVQLGAGVAGTLSSASEALVLGGANLAMVGDEMLQFRTATLTGTRTYLLTGFLRGRRGTEWAMPGHAVGDRFVLMSTVTDVQLQSQDIGMPYLYRAVTNGQPLASAVDIPMHFHAIRMRPYSPAQIGGGSDASGNVTIDWIRRTRIGGAWTNFGEVPLSENIEQYVVQIWDSTFTDCARTTVVDDAQTWEYTAAMQVTDFGVVQQQIYVTIGQVGSYSLGTQLQETVQGLPSGTLDSPVLVPIDPYPTIYEPPPTTTTSVDQNHMANFASLMGSDRQLAYKYATLGPLVGIGWYQRHQFEIINRFFLGNTTAWANWVQDAEYNRPFLTGPENTLLFGLAAAAGS